MGRPLPRIALCLPRGRLPGVLLRRIWSVRTRLRPGISHDARLQRLWAGLRADGRPRTGNAHAHVWRHDGIQRILLDPGPPRVTSAMTSRSTATRRHYTLHTTQRGHERSLE